MSSSACYTLLPSNTSVNGLIIQKRFAGTRGGGQPARSEILSTDLPEPQTETVPAPMPARDITLLFTTVAPLHFHRQLVLQALITILGWNLGLSSDLLVG